MTAWEDLTGPALLVPLQKLLRAAQTRLDDTRVYLCGETTSEDMFADSFQVSA